MSKARYFALLVLFGVMNALFAMSVKPPTFEELVAGAEQVLRTEVLSTRCVVKGEGSTRRIVTLVKVRVEKVIVGTAPAELELEFLGGQVGDEGLEVGGMTKFTKGDRDILFVTGNGKYFCPLMAVNYGRYFLVSNEGKTGEFVARADSTPLSNEKDVTVEIESVGKASALPVGSTALSVEDFEARIITCAKGLKAPAASVK